jgi:hypothetical protein
MILLGILNLTIIIKCQYIYGMEGGCIFEAIMKKQMNYIIVPISEKNNLEY